MEIEKFFVEFIAVVCNYFAIFATWRRARLGDFISHRFLLLHQPSSCVLNIRYFLLRLIEICVVSSQGFYA